MKVKDILKCIVSLSLIGLAGTSDSAFAIGRYLATTSLAGEDATNKFFNPAALISLKGPQFVIQDFNLYSHKSFTGVMTDPGIHSPIIEHGSTSTNGITNVGSGITLIPAFYFGVPLTSKLALGVDVVPYPQIGLKYPADSIFRYDAIKAFERSVDINTSLGYQFHPKFSAGVGLDSDYLDESIKFKVRTQLLTTQDSLLNITVRSWNFGWHGGFLYVPTRATQIGLAYHSPIITHLQGSSSFYPKGIRKTTPLPVVKANDSKLILPFAGITTFTVHQMFTPRFGTYGTVEFRGWGIYKYDHAYNIASPSKSGVTNNISYKGLHNSWYFSVTSHYSFTEKAIGFISAAHSTNPSHAENRSALSSYFGTNDFLLGLHYQFTKQVGVDAAAAHVFKNVIPIDKRSTSGGSNIIGTSTETADLAFAQLVFDFV